MPMTNAHLRAIEALNGLPGHPLVRSFPHGALIVFDMDLRYIAAGGLSLSDVGLSAELLEGRTMFEVFPREVTDILEPLYRQVLLGDETTLDVPYQGRIYLQRLAPLRAEDGEIVAGMGFMQDVTQARASERALIRSEQQFREESRRLRNAQAIGRVGSWEWDIATNEVVWSDTLFALYGLAPLRFGGTYEAAIACVHPDDRASVNASMAACLSTGEPMRLRYRVTRADSGMLRWFDARGERISEDGAPVRLAGAVADVTEQMLAEAETRSAHAFFDAVLTATPDYTFVAALDTGEVVYGSRDRDVLGRHGGEIAALAKEQITQLVHPDDQESLHGSLPSIRALADGDVLQTRYRGRHADGQWHWLSRRITPFRRADTGEVLDILGVVRDITDVVQAEEKLSHAALHDDLTGLPNRSLLIDRLETALERSRRDGRVVAVLFCDLDGFKRVNDTAGHAAGDAVLLETARRLHAVLRESDTVARVGGDEFVLLIEPWNRQRTHSEPATSSVIELDRALALQIAARVTEALRQPISVSGVEHVVTASIGISYTAPHQEGGLRSPTAEEIIQDADAAMYRAKTHGRDRIEVFEHSLRSDMAERGRVEQILRRALRDHANPAAPPERPLAGSQIPYLSAAYQPVFDSLTSRLVGFEVLARLSGPDGSDIRPDVFIAVAEDVGLIHPLGKVMLHLACRQLALWRASRRGLESLTMAVNVSALQASHGSLGEDVRAALALHQMAPSDLVLELTETAFLRAGQSTINAIRELRTDGVGIAIDDFGTGYASLRYLATLPVSALKVDKSFTSGLPANRTSQKIVNAVAGLAADLDLVCVIEGVETEEQRAVLPAGVHLQGWLMGRPERPEKIDFDGLVG